MYQKIIYPAIWKKEYEEPEQLSLFDDEDELATDTDTIDTSNVYAKTKNQFKKGNTSGIRFISNRDDPQLTIDDISKQQENI